MRSGIIVRPVSHSGNNTIGSKLFSTVRENTVMRATQKLSAGQSPYERNAEGGIQFSDSERVIEVYRAARSAGFEYSESPKT